MDDIKAIINNVKNRFKELKSQEISVIKELLTVFSIGILIMIPFTMSITTGCLLLLSIYPIMAVWWLYFMSKEDE